MKGNELASLRSTSSNEDVACRATRGARSSKPNTTTERAAGVMGCHVDHCVYPLRWGTCLSCCQAAPRFSQLQVIPRS